MEGCHKIVLEFLDCVLNRENYQNSIQGRGKRQCKKQNKKGKEAYYFNSLINYFLSTTNLLIRTIPTLNIVIAVIPITIGKI